MHVLLFCDTVFWMPLLSLSKEKSIIRLMRVPDQNGVCQAWYIVEIHHAGWNPSN